MSFGQNTSASTVRGDTAIIPEMDFRTAISIFRERDRFRELSDSLKGRLFLASEVIAAQGRQIVRYQSAASIDSLEIANRGKYIEIQDGQIRDLKGQRWKWGAGGTGVGVLIGVLIAVFAGQ